VISEFFISILYAFVLEQLLTVLEIENMFKTI